MRIKNILRVFAAYLAISALAGPAHAQSSDEVGSAAKNLAELVKASPTRTENGKSVKKIYFGGDIIITYTPASGSEEERLEIVQKLDDGLEEMFVDVGVDGYEEYTPGDGIFPGYMPDVSPKARVKGREAAHQRYIDTISPIVANWDAIVYHEDLRGKARKLAELVKSKGSNESMNDQGEVNPYIWEKEFPLEGKDAKVIFSDRNSNGRIDNEDSLEVSVFRLGSFGTYEDWDIDGFPDYPVGTILGTAKDRVVVVSDDIPSRASRWSREERVRVNQAYGGLIETILEAEK